MISINDFKKEVLVWAEKVRVKPAEIHVRKMRRKWASCSNKGRLTFSYDLLSKPEDFWLLSIDIKSDFSSQQIKLKINKHLFTFAISFGFPL